MSLQKMRRGSEILDFLEPVGRRRIAGHSPVGSRRERNRSDLWTIRNATALELLRKKALQEKLENAYKFFMWVFCFNCGVEQYRNLMEGFTIEGSIREL